MAKLIISVDGQVLDEVELVKERTTIGRKPHNDVRIENLAVSGEHAAIVTILNDSFLEDLGSTNGTTVNGHPIKKHFLQNNDVVEIGKYKLKYINEKASLASAADFEKTMVLRPQQVAAAQPSTMPGSARVGDPTAARPGGPEDPTATRPGAFSNVTATTPGPLPGLAPGLVGQPAPSPLAIQTGAQPLGALPPVMPTSMPGAGAVATPMPAAPMPAAIQILTGPSAGKELDLVKNLTTLGKPGVQVAVITKRPHGFFITHVEGAQYPSVNGHSLDAQPRQLHDHDIIELAGVKMEFFHKPG
ncbi:MAG: FHA domain-containing protein [bacterium]|jgi:predicted component of type VI protein secretion system|nr:FHA domain-containing protein [Betaproteobacteria bacterium]